ncbi:TonB-dependent receptor [Ferrimonas balearica DSM 9799]|uniref:TonB-dependent receptor n=1 Tax=Ferrimonas balearica (strain DSM 9799 / CCM 4581 / KCTC 23876 / PAT) TaxID=550540 RepID=E1SL79_FERBD|nr:TonB-dependent receptor [Ferrimonas balearica]ADN75457.1 TonB-dependent receptor [Ferrimonas balearica DSM 9799]
MKPHRIALAVTTALLSTPLLAAEDASGANEPERIEVTGTRIKRVDVEGVSPLTVITADEIANSGLSSISEVLATSIANNGASFDGDEASGYTTGASSVNLRGMGANRTLVLINGRRQAAFPTAAGGVDNFVDVSDIPSAAVDRIEILTGGASAIYGSDAIGGVVNIYLKKEYEGGDLSARYEAPEADGRDQFTLSYTQGFNTERSNTVLMLEYKNAEELLTSQRQDYFAEGLNRIYSATGDISVPPYLVNQETGEPWAWTENWGWGDALPSSWGANLYDYDEFYHDDKYNYSQESCEAILGDKAVWYDYSSSRKCRYDKYSDRGLESAYDRVNLVLNTEYELSDDWSLYAMVNASYKDSEKYKDEKGFDRTFYQDTATGRIDYSRSGMDDYAKFKVYRRMEEFPGPRIYESTNEKYSLAFGANGYVGDYELDVSWSSGFNKYSRDSQHMIDAAALLDVISFDPNESDPSRWYVLDVMTPEQAEAIMGVSSKRSESSIHQFTTTLTGDLVDLPYGPLAFASSIEWAREDYEDILDDTTQSGGYIGMGGTGGEGDRDRYAAALEFLVPLLSNVTGAQRLELSVAGRYDYYDDETDVGGAFSPQVGLMYNPVENVLVRGSWGQSFRAPDMHRIYAGETIGFGETEYDLPNGEVYEDSYTSYKSGNLALEEEKGDYASIGIVANLTDNLDLTLDWWTIELDGAVRTISSSYIYNGPNDYKPEMNYTGQYDNCDQLPDVGFILETDDNGFDNLMCIRSGPINVAYEKSEGVDGSLNYALEDTGAGDFKFEISASYLLSKEVKDFEFSEPEEYTETEYFPHWKGKASINWSLEDLSASLSYYYTGTAEGVDLFDYYNSAGDNIEEMQTDKLAAFGRLNLSMRYGLPWDGSVRVGVNNLTDELPPYYNVRNTEHDSFPFYREDRGYSMVGRSYYLSYSQKF